MGAIGFAGGIWLGWKSSIHVKVIRNHAQFILTRVWSTSISVPIMIAFVYGSPNRKKRQDLWRSLRASTLVGQTSWVSIGDFNAILASNEKLGGSSPSKRFSHFGDFVESSDLHDLGFTGSYFTWHRGNLFEKVDRALGNEAWTNTYPNSMVMHLPKIKSDHKPFLLNLRPKITLPRG